MFQILTLAIMLELLHWRRHDVIMCGWILGGWYYRDYSTPHISIPFPLLSYAIIILTVNVLFHWLACNHIFSSTWWGAWGSSPKKQPTLSFFPASLMIWTFLENRITHILFLAWTSTVVVLSANCLHNDAKGMYT